VSSQLQINYIARQCIDDLPFITKDDTLPGMLDVLSCYTQVLDRHESLASNLGARPLGPILIKRFERCFDAPPRVIASHSHARDQDLPLVSWLDVVHFAQAHPSQFTLSTFSEGRRVCQFYYAQKQVRVQISEEDFLFINSGRCQDLIPPLPIWEDEEKEVATCELVEKALRDLTAAADSVAARTRQLAHRLKGRRMAILERRAGDESHNPQSLNTAQQQPPVHQQPQAQQRPHAQQQQRPPSPAANLVDGASHIRNDLLKHFQSLPKQPPPTQAEPRRLSSMQQQQYQPQSPPSHTPPNLHNHSRPHLESTSSSVSPVPTNVAAIAAAAAAAHANNYRDESPKDMPRHNFSKPLLPSQEVSQPYRTLCQSHMESLPRSSRVLPPCDRCRRLKMDCLKNLSSCAGCTKKHARCHWKNVARDEVVGLEGFEEAERLALEYATGRHASVDYPRSDASMEGDTRTPYEYITHPAASNPLQYDHVQHHQQQQQPYPQPPAQHQLQHQRPAVYGELETPNNNTHLQPQSHARPPFSDNIGLQQHQQQPQQHVDSTLDLLRILGNHANTNTNNNNSNMIHTNNSGLNSVNGNGYDNSNHAEGIARNIDTTTVTTPRNNGAFRSSFVSSTNGGEAEGGHVDVTNAATAVNATVVGTGHDDHDDGGMSIDGIANGSVDGAAGGGVELSPAIAVATKTTTTTGT
jgi:hypothetical protein